MSKLYSRLLGLGTLLGLLGTVPAWSQTVNPNRCGTQEADARQQAELKRLNPNYNPAKSTTTTTPTFARSTGVTYTLPVIVHVIHNGEAVGTGTNLSVAQIQSQIDVLNEDYRNLNADGSLVPGVYQPRRGDVQLQFVMAQRDPNGNVLAEPGIDRVNRNTKSFSAPPYGGTTSPNTSYIDGTIKPATYWNPEQYINIWTMDLNGGGLLGYAQFPDNTAGLGGLSALGGAANTDGVVIKHSAFGSRAKVSSGTYGTGGFAVFDRGRTLTHELGHFFSLRHIWGDASCGNDYVADTPTQQAYNGGCPTFPHITCSNGTGDMSMNYMDYTNDACMYMFSGGQADRIQLVMSSNTPRRSNLVNSPAICANVAAATAASNSPACVGGTINLQATGPAGATFAWTGPSGFTSTAQNPTIANATAAMAGIYSVKVTPATSGVCPGTATTTVVVNPAPPTPTLNSSAAGFVCAGTAVTLSTPVTTPGSNLPSADFNSGLPAGWGVASTGTGANTQWQVTAGNTYSYTGAFTLTNITLDNSRFAIANSDAGGSNSTTNTTLTTPSFSTVGYSTLQLAFQQVFLPYTGNGAVEVSTNNGSTWTAVATYTSQQGNLTTTSATPVTSTVNLNAYINQANVRVRWHYTDVWGYIWALDNVAFTGTAASFTYNYTLVSGDGLPAVTNTPSITVTPTQNSVYSLSVAYAGSTCTSSATVAVNVIPAPTSPTVTASQSQLCGAGTTTLTGANLPTSAGSTFRWELVSGDGLPAVVNTASISVSPTRTSIYRLTVTNSCGVSASSAPFTVTVINNSIQPYPVPVTDTGITLRISTCTAGSLGVVIFDSMGRRVYDQTVPSVAAGNDQDVRLAGSENLAGGKYTLQVTKGTQTQTFNIVLSR